MLFRAGLLTAVHIPPPEIESVRDLARARADVKDDLQRAQRRLLAFCLRHGHIYATARTGRASTRLPPL